MKDNTEHPNDILEELIESGGFLGNPTAYPSTSGYVYDWSKIREAISGQCSLKPGIKGLSDISKCE